MVVAALLDATVLAEDPVADTANVELRDEAEMKAAILRLQNERDQLLRLAERSRDELARVERLVVPAPDTKLALELPRYELTHGAGATGMAVELLPACADARVAIEGGAEPLILPVAQVFSDGTHRVVTTCPHDGTTTETVLVVGPR